jgi:hypothetical protein
VRFSAIHKLSTYLVAATAFLAVVLSGELDPFTILLGTVGLAASWWVEPPAVRIDRYSGVYTALSLIALAVAVLTALSGEFLLAGARFLIHLLVIKMLSRRASKDYQQIYLLSFLLLTIGTAINTGMSFAICFLGFVVFATWALILFHLRREMEENFLLKHSDDASSEKVEVERILNSRRIVGPAFLAGTSGVSLAIFLSAIVMFLFIPRIGFGLFFQKSRSGINVAGFSDDVELGGHGTIRDDNTVVMRVYLDRADYRGVAGGAQLHWRGIALDHYDRGHWSRSRNLRFVHQPYQTDAMTTTVFMARDEQPMSGMAARKRAFAGLHQDIYVEPLDTDVLFAAAAPLAFRAPNLGLGARQQTVQAGSGDEARISRTTGIRYEAWSDPEPPPAHLLAAAPDADPAGAMRTYLQLPPALPPRIRELAQQITRDAHGPYAKAAAIYDYLQANYTYTLEMATDEKFEPLDYFLFERKKGHCEYFSSAMAILLRAVDVPTRNVNGFLGGEWNEYGGYLAVRGGDAHSWVEVWFDGVGWVTWDPTPAAGEVNRGSGLLDRMRRLMDTARLQWFKWVLEYDLTRQIKVLRGLSDFFGLGKSHLSMRSVRTWVKRHQTGLAVGTFVLLALALLAGWWRNRQRPGAATRRARPPSDPVQQTYARTVAWLSRRGWPRLPSQTPREHAQTLVRGGAPGASAFATFTELYYEARFGDSEAASEAEVAEAHHLADEIRAAFAEAEAAARRKQPRPTA